MTWLTTQYPVGKQFDASDPDTGQPVPVTVTGYWKNTMSRDTGIEVETSDGREFNISAGYLWEDGNGIYDPPRSAGRPFLSDSPTVKIEVTLPAILRDKLDRIADGNRSAWIRQAIETAKEIKMYTNTSQARAEELNAKGFEVWVSPTYGFFVKDAPYLTGDVAQAELPKDAFEF